MAVFAVSPSYPRDRETLVQASGVLHHRYGLTVQAVDRQPVPDGPFLDSLDARVATLKEALSHDGPAFLWAARGGLGSYEVALQLHDWLRDFRPRGMKALMGYSDISALHLLWRLHGLGPSFLGPHPGGIAQGRDPLSFTAFETLLEPGSLEVVMQGKWLTPPPTPLSPLGRGSGPSASLRTGSTGGEGPNMDSPPMSGPSSGPSDHLLPRGEKGIAALPSQAVLLGGNVTVLASTLGGPLWADLPETFVLCLEDIDEEPYQLDRSLLALEGAGVLQKASAIVLGDFNNCEKPEGKYGPTFREVIGHRLGRLNLPVFLTDHFGHGAHQGLVPLGVPVTLAGVETHLSAKFTGAY